MDLSHLVNVALGLMFFYLLLSLVCTAGNELAASLLQRRSRNLENGIEQILGDLKKSFYEHPLITMLSAQGRKASYVPAQAFSSVLLDLVFKAQAAAPRALAGLRTKIGEVPDEALRQRLLVLLDDAGDDLTKFRANIEAMFDRAMDRVAGVYKRKTQMIVLGWAFAVTLATNADTIRVATTLARDPELAAAVAKSAREASARHDSTARADSTNAAAVARPDSAPAARAPADSVHTEPFKRSVDDLQASGLPIGWESSDWPKRLGLGGALVEASWGWFFSKLLGFLITALAVSLGAPFWFDMLGKVVRATGKVPQRAAA